MKIKIPKGKPQKSRGKWERSPVTKVKESAKDYQRDKKNWEMEDFVESVDAVMQEQEKKSPEIKQVHAQLSPEWKQVSEKIGKLLTCEKEEEIVLLREEIVAQGPIAVRVLLDFLLSIKKNAKE